MSSLEFKRRRVVITGRGCITPLGNEPDTFANNLNAGKSGIVRQAQPRNEKVQIAGEVNNFNPGDFMDEKDIERSIRLTHMAVAAARLAGSDAKIITPAGSPDNPYLYLPIDAIEPERIGVIISIAVGVTKPLVDATTSFLQRKGRIPANTLILSNISHTPALVAKTIGSEGSFKAINGACAGGLLSILDGYHEISSGKRDVMFVGGSEDPRDDSIFTGAYAVFPGLLSKNNENPTKACKPFDRFADGTVLGEGAGILVLEALEVAQARGAHIYGEVLGGETTNIVGEGVMTSPEGYAKVIRATLRNTGLTEDDIDYINPHGPGTKGDKFELEGIRLAMPRRYGKIPISSITAAIGHLQGGKGSVESIGTLEMMRRSLVAPTLNYDEPEIEGFDIVTKPRPHQIRKSLIVKAGLDGIYVGVCLGQYAA